MSSFILVLNTVNAGKVRTAATLLANEQMEKLRGLPYNDLATENGTILPQGEIPDSQTVERSGISYELETTIITVDDPFDGCAIPSGSEFECTNGEISESVDTVPVDYKRISVVVRQQNESLILSSLVSDAAAKAAETPSNTGMVLICIQDSNGQPIEGATIVITNEELELTVQGVSNSNGCVFVANVPPDNQNGYHVVVTKDGYSTDFTTERTAQNPNQVQPDLDVYTQEVTIQNLSIDLLADMSLTVIDETGAPVASLGVTATSEKITQNNPVVPKNIYSGTTAGDGTLTFTDIEWDSYSITVPTGYYILATSPYQKVSVLPNSNQQVNLVVSTSSNQPVIESVSPTSGIIGQSVEVLIEGQNFPGSATVKLSRDGYSDIIPTSINVAANEKSIEVVFDLTGVAAGSWDIVVTVNGQSIRQINGFTVS